jgi:hypothetical protein
VEGLVEGGCGPLRLGLRVGEATSGQLLRNPASDASRQGQEDKGEHEDEAAPGHQDGCETTEHESLLKG